MDHKFQIKYKKRRKTTKSQKTKWKKIVNIQKAGTKMTKSKKNAKK